MVDSGEALVLDCVAASAKEPMLFSKATFISRHSFTMQIPSMLPSTCSRCPYVHIMSADCNDVDLSQRILWMIS